MNLYLPNYYLDKYGHPQYIDPSLADEELDMLARSVYAYRNNFTEESSKMFKSIFGIDISEEKLVKDFKKKALENKLIQLSSDLLSIKENYRNLVMPNAADTLKALEQSILSLRNKSKDSTTATELHEWAVMTETRQRYLVGKQLVGIGAVQLTSHVIGQIAGIKLTGTYKDSDGNILPIVIHLNHNKDENGKLNLSSVTDTEGNWISDLLSEAVTGFVDAAKDPFVFELNININTAGTYFYLMKLGVPIEDNVLFHTQPSIVEYVKNIDRNNSVINDVNNSKEYLSAIKHKTLIPYYKALGIPTINAKKAEDIAKGKIKEYLEANPILDINKMKSNISYLSNPEHVVKSEEAIYQLIALDDFLKYNDQARNLSNFTRAISYDTRKTKNIIENDLQKSDWAKMLNDGFIENPEAVLEKTFLGESKLQKEDIPEMFRDYFVMLHPKIDEVKNKMLTFLENEGARLSNEDKGLLLNKYQNFVISYLINTTTINEKGKDFKFGQYYNLFRDREGRNSLAKDLVKFKNQFPENQALKELYPIISQNRNSTDNIKLFGTKLSPFEVNVITESLINLMDEAKVTGNIQLQNFINKLVIFSSLQSGVQQSPISFTRILPVDFYSNLVAKIFEAFDESETIPNADIIWKQFHQNNYTNSLLLPSANKQYVDSETGVMVILENSRLAKFEYLSTKKIKPGYTNEEIAEKIKDKKWDDILVNKIYQRLYSADGKVFYREINKLGNKMYMLEVYETDTENMDATQLVNSNLHGYIDENNFKNYTDIQSLSPSNNVSLQGMEALINQNQLLEDFETNPEPINKTSNELENLYKEIKAVQNKKEEDSKNCNK